MASESDPTPVGRDRTGVGGARWMRLDGPSAGLRLVLVGYALLATLATGLALGLTGRVPWTHPEPWLRLDPLVGALYSLAGGLAYAAVIIVLTRVLVARYSWARRLHDELRPAARDLGLGHVIVLAALSSLGEELLFRGVLTVWLGVIGSSIVFGLAHQIRGASRWVWAGWAAAVGLGLGALFAATGSLVGPLVAHAVVNAVNLVFLRDHAVEERVGD